MLVLVLPPVSSRVSGFPVALAVSMGEAAKTCPFVMLPTVKIAGSLAQNASFFCIHVFLSRVSRFPVGVAVSMGEAAKPLLFECFHAGCPVVLRGRRGSFLTFQPV